jgi:hypothetical protein
MKPEAAAQPLHNPGPPLSVEEGNERLTALSSLDRDGLVAEWQAVFRHPAPRGAQVNLLRGALASKCQLDADDRGKYKKLSRQLRYWTAHAQVVALQPGARLLTSGRYDGVQAIATEVKMTSSYITRVIYLAYLAPDIALRILSGDHPSELNAKKLLSLVPFPDRWEEQRRLLGM